METEVAVEGDRSIRIDAEPFELEGLEEVLPRH